MQNIFSPSRNSRMEIGEVYFWTATVYQWKKLLKPDPYKQILCESLDYLYQQNLVRVYGFTVMPNHIHLLWEILKNNGKELPNASFTKFTAHKIWKDLEMNHPKVLEHFHVEEKDRSHRIWQRDPLSITITSREMFEQKLDYIHHNPLQSHWNLVSDPIEYHYSSAQFYMNEKSDFRFLTHYKDRL